MRMLLASLLFTAACSSEVAYADQVAAPLPPGPRTALAIAPVKARAPYDVQVVRENGETAPTYALKDRFYVQGSAGERYTIRITNPTPSRVEAVVTVDGLDVIDGDTSDLHKRGYIVPAYGETRVEGFRTSLSDVATFRFSSVDGSYAGKQGKARNVGVIAVALFEEQAAPPDQQIVAPVATGRPYDYTDDLDASAAHAPSGGAGGRVATKTDRAAPKGKDYWRPADKKAPSAEPTITAGESRAAPASRPMPPHHESNYSDDEGGFDQQQAPTTNRLGLGTEFGEQRTSSASYTRFVRAANRPVAIAELRYNDGAGLTALGVLVQPLPDPGEIMLRETADPFPGDHFARGPGR